MQASTIALLGAGALALGAAAPSHAAQPPSPATAQPIVVFVPVPMGLFAPPPLALERVFAAQEAAMTQLIAQMSQMPAFPALRWMASAGDACGARHADVHGVDVERRAWFLPGVDDADIRP